MIIKKSNFQKKIVEEETKPDVEEDIEDLAEDVVPEETPEEKYANLEQEVFNIDNIDFSQREEKRTGTRRRSYRRIDDRNLVSRAQEEAAQIRENAYQEGYSQGMEALKNDFVSFKSNLGAFLSSDKRVFEALAPDLMEISLMIATKIIKHQVTIDPKIVLDTVMDILKTIPKNEPKITISVSPAQAQYTRDNIPEVMNALGIEAKINIVAEESVQDGSCIVQTSNGIIDASMEAQIDIITNALRSA